MDIPVFSSVLLIPVVMRVAPTRGIKMGHHVSCYHNTLMDEERTCWIIYILNNPNIIIVNLLTFYTDNVFMFNPIFVLVSGGN